MNYRHIYHAGMFADVFKHIVLVLVVESLLNKDKPFCYIDTHAGIGLYDLQHAAAQKTQEYKSGLLPLVQAPDYPALLQPYLAAIAASNGLSKLTTLPQYYPGSPAIVSHLLRPQDRMLLNELHPEDLQTLKTFFKRNKQVVTYQMDAYQLLKAVLPPKERRGLVLIDPAYEQNNESELITMALINALQRWETGIYAVWYPIKDKITTDKFLRKIKTQVNKEMLVAELTIYPDTLKTALIGCGKLIINPPWQLDVKLQAIMPWLWGVLSPQKQGGYEIKFM